MLFVPPPEPALRADEPHRRTVTTDRPELPRRRDALSHRRLVALVEVLICSDLPSQILLHQMLLAGGYQPFVDGRLSAGFVFALSILDSLLLIALISFFLVIHGEGPRELFLGRRPIAREALIGVLLVPGVFLFVVGMLALLQAVAPALHNVSENPLQGLIRSPRDAWMFTGVAILAGGMREEMQRAFILRRFEEHLGGARVGVMVVSAAFGAGHALQGWDAAVVTAMLGALWGVVYLRRRSIVAPVVSHSGFNTAEIFRYLAYGT